MWIWESVDLPESPNRETSKSAPKRAFGSALRNPGAVRSAPESALQGFFLRRTTGRAPSRALSGGLVRDPDFWEHSPEHSLALLEVSPFWKCLAGRQTLKFRSGPGKPNQRKVSSWTFPQGHSGTKVRYANRACFPKAKHQNSQKWAKFMNFFVLAFSLVWFAGATPDKCGW